LHVLPELKLINMSKKVVSFILLSVEINNKGHWPFLRNL